MEEPTNTPERERTLRDLLTESQPDSTWLDAHAELIAKLESAYNAPAETKEVSSDVRYYGFSIGELNVLIAENTPCEILEENIIYSIPLTPNWLIGTCNVRGDIVPIIDLEHILTGKIRIVEPHKYKTFIIGEAENTIGLLLNKLPIQIHFKKENQTSIFSELPKLVRPFITIGYKRNQEVWACIDFASFFATLTNQQEL